MIHPKLIPVLPNHRPPCTAARPCRPLSEHGLWLTLDMRILYFDSNLWVVRRGTLYGRRSGVATTALSGLEPVSGQPGVFLGGLRGLGAIDDLVTRLDVLQAEYDSLKAESHALVASHPELDSVSFEEFVRRVASLAPGTILRLTLGQFQQLTNAMLISTIGNITRARALLPLGDTARSRIDKLLTAGKNTLHAYRNLLDGIEAANARADQVRRAVGLGVAPAVVIAGIVAGTIVLVVGGALVYALLSSIQSSTVASQEADRMCAADAAAGTPCTGADRARYVAAVLEEQRRSGLVPDFGNAIRELGSTVFWGGMLAVVGLLAYGAWITAPAATITRERLRARAAR
jgi:hypothetical protein